MNLLPVYILGADNPNSLGILRSLAKEHIPAVAAFVQKGPSVSLSSRHWIEKVAVSSREQLVDALLAHQKHDQRLPLFCATDDELLWIDEHRERLETKFILPKSEHSSLRELLPKNSILRLGTQAGFLVPKTLQPSDLEKGEEIAFPVMVKALTSDLTSELGFHRFGDRVALMNWLSQNNFGDEQVVIQEYLDPTQYRSYEIQSCILDGRPRIIGIHEKLVATPRAPDGPPVLACLLRRVSMPELETPMLDLTEQAGLNGPLNTEILVGPRGHFFLESNLRFSLNTPLDTAAGMNLPALVYREWMGIKPNPIPAPVEDHPSMVYEHASTLYFLRYAGEGRWNFLRDVFSAKQRLYFEWDDPLPFAHMLMEFGPMRAIKVLRSKVFADRAA